MLTGLSGYHLHDFQRTGNSSPFLALLNQNGYRLRIAKKAHIDSANLFTLFPAGTVLFNIDSHLNGGDLPMVDAYLADRRGRTEQPSFDFLAFDATHWPYSFPPEDAVFQPAPPSTSSYHLLRSISDLEPIRNRYRNACHFVDGQIGRVLDDLQTRGDFDRTVIVLVGDHGEEFQERGQLTHSAVLNDFQGRTVLWMHLPDAGPERRDIGVPTIHTDIVPTILQSFGFSADVLYTQGVSLLERVADRPMLSLCEQGWAIPNYRALVTPTYISRWRYSPEKYLFSGVQRRDGGQVEGDEWLREVHALYRGAALMYEVMPDVSQPPRPFGSAVATQSSE
jgi:membrane-anchored protein YejM (alkaline phosphatase superfamily)